MFLGVRIQNYGLFSDGCIGALMDDIRKAPEQSSLALGAGVDLAFPLSSLEALIGRNHSGKSMFFSFLSFVQSTVISGPAAASVESERSGFTNLLIDKDQPIKATLCFLFPKTENYPKTYCEYELVLAPNVHGKPHFEEETLRLWRKDMEAPQEILHFKNGVGFVFCQGEKSEGEMNDPQTSALRAYGALKQYHFIGSTYREIGMWFFVRFQKENTQALPDDVAPGGHKHLNAEGTNARNVLLYMKKERPELYSQLIDRLIESIPGLRKKNEEAVLKFFKKPDILALYLLLLSDPNPRPLLLIESPDEGLYHDMVDALASEMRNFTISHPKCQIIFTTHNPYIIENLAPDEIWVFSRGDEDEVGISCAASSAIVSEMYKQGVGMGAIWYAGHFDDMGESGES